ncbi:hypothetical protein PII47_26670 [Pseudomonas sp. 21TX0197]|uniref:hypothetical protein n=2 Tax=Pseudomonas TaxID=286 RepID=UPI00232C69ED|nr:hypothetical protein [Pseudomonas sp. 21TX0197]MDB6446982.1 hypothetical protein [Pseudomonas sp. 21TX0197]
MHSSVANPRSACLGEEAMPDEPPENLENLPGFTGSEGLALCHNDKKPSQNITLHSALSTTSPRRSKISMELLLTPKSRQNPHFKRLSL